MISAAQLRAQLGVCVILDCRFDLADTGAGLREYRAAHIPGAHYLHLEDDLSGPRGTHGGRHPLPSPAVFTTRLAQLGIQRDTPVVAYDDSRFCFAARLWWMMTALGYTDVRLLDGGFAAWRSSGFETARAMPEGQPGAAQPSAVQPGAVQPGAAPDVGAFAGVVDRSELQLLSTQDVLLVDSRDARRYAGLEEPIDPVAGHIPGAVNLPWQGVTDERGFARPARQQRERWEALGPSSDTVVYCGSGVSACVNLLSLELAGYDRARLYPGSWSDWCSYL
ncbi:MAG: sulfurtransferase [Halieaceae bacterium]|jgi:thiosulfate/3-mercaptopyruvate sulfurtransferase|nr:sulfurtransferase [Halieaceae bacterium]